jgi:hypothetical protein
MEPGAEPEVAIINGPEGAQIEGIADAFAAAIDELGTPGFDVVRDVALAGVEERRNLGGSQAVPSAAGIGRSFGAEFTLMLGAVDIQRDVFEAGRDQVRIEVQLSVEGVLVRASDERVIARIESRTFSGQRFADASASLPELRFDPTAAELGSRGAAALAPVFREIIAAQVNENSSE